MPGLKGQRGFDKSMVSSCAFHSVGELGAVLPGLVYAYRDDGAQDEKTKWKPRRVYCTADANHADPPGIPHVVKYARDRESAAALISEAVSTRLLAAGGLATLDMTLVRASESFAASCNSKSDFPYAILQGDHFGTILREDVEAGPPLAYDDIAEPFEIVRLWVFDTWLCNIDRDTYGNTLLKASKAGKFSIIASDQSDCFCGTGRFCSADFAKTMGKRGPAPAIKLLVSAISNTGGPAGIKKAIATVNVALGSLNQALGCAAEAWWGTAKIDPDEVAKVLIERAAKLEDILKPSQWGVPDGAIIL